MKLVENIMTKNPCYTAGKKITVKGLMLHSVGCAQPKASVFIDKWNTASYDRACVHGFIDANDGTVYQTLPWNHRGWHCGGSGNNTHIGVEMCEPACIKYTSGASFTCSDLATAKACAKRTYDSAVQLFAKLCKQYSLDPTASGVIVSHKEGCAKGIASNHGDPEHLWKGLGLSYTMDGFRKDVKSAMGSTTTTTSTATTSTTATTTSSGTKTSVPYIVRVKAANLNMRKGPGVNYAKVGKYTGKGAFTIVEEKTGKIDSKGTIGTWGKLKSNGYWICLAYSAYTEKV